MEQMEKILFCSQRPALSFGFESHLLYLSQSQAFAPVIAPPTPTPHPFLHYLSHTFWMILFST